MQDPAYKQILGANETLLANAVGGDNLRVFDMELYVCTHHQTLAPIGSTGYKKLGPNPLFY